MGTMAQLTPFYLSILSLLSLAFSRAIDQSRYEPIPAKLFRRDYDPQDFSWVKKMGAIGDSFTAGIGAGSPLGSFWGNRADWKCSRYDQAYPNVVYDEINDSVEKFQYLACSGDRSTGIYDQVKELDDDMDFIIMTAGGNDLCLVRTCHYTKEPWLIWIRLGWHDQGLRYPPKVRRRCLRRDH
jgi:lysophospholipase L1-like esterase